MTKNAVTWIREDFRIEHNPALAYATQNHENVFALYIYESIFAFGVSAISHLCLIIAIVITVSTFRQAEKFRFDTGYHTPDRQRGYTIYRDKQGNAYKVPLPKGDPGGEHE